jgi:polysaccharide export outer membrane protein
MVKLLAIIICAVLSSAALAEDGGYVLNPGDMLGISVWKEEGLEREVMVLPDGTISFPLAGQMMAAGRTTSQLESELTERLTRFVPDAVVTVFVVNTAGNKIYVLGQVNKPGEYQVIRPINVMQALSLAGGLTAFASEDDIKILRQVEGRETALPFDYSDVQAGESLEMNVILQSGDVIVVPSSSLF